MVVITNPPFSLFREYVAQLVKYDKKFLIVGSMNAITYKKIFLLIKDNKLWLGYNSVKEFKQPDGSIKKFGNILWYTNLETTKRNMRQELCLSYERRDREYPKYDNYDAIEVSKAVEIPYDYDGVIGVPITWLDKYSPTQFSIVGCADADIIPEGWKGASKEFVKLYYAQGNTGCYKEGNRLTHYINKDGKAIIPYKRILIRRRPEDINGRQQE